MKDQGCMDSGKRNKRKGISTFIATLLLIVLAIAAGVVVYAYVMGFLGGVGIETRTGTLQIQSVSEFNGFLHIYARNIGGDSVKLDQNGFYLNDRSFTSYTPMVIYTTNLPSNEVAEGVTLEIKIDLSQPAFISLIGKSSTFKIVTVNGGVILTTYKINGTGGNGLNKPPVLALLGDKNVDELNIISFTAIATDPNFPTQTLTYSLDASAPSGASITPQGDFIWTPTEAQGPGTYSITIRVTDNGSPPLNDFETITVIVREYNEAPTLETIPDQIITKYTKLAFTAVGSDVDIPVNTLTYSLIGAPNGATIDPNSGEFTWIPEIARLEPYAFTVRVTDNNGLYAQRSVHVTVNEF
jgi:FlaG/FlaF family flagellin (archaellin)